MVSFRFFLILSLLMLPLSAAGQSTVRVLKANEARVIPAGTALQIRLRQTISSFGSKSDTPISALVIAPVEVGRHIVLPLNSDLLGSVIEVQRVGIGLARERPMIEMGFNSLTLSDGKTFPLHGHIISVDDSRETVDAEGRIHGIRATESISSTISGLAISAAGMDPMALFFAMSASLGAFRIPESEIILPAGAELRFRLDKPLPVSETFPPIAPPLIHSEEDRTALTRLIRRLPFRTRTAKGRIPSDLTSLLFIGSEDSLLQAFNAAGWVRSDALSTRSRFGVMRSVLENQGYRQAPVSTLLLKGAAPVAAYSKTLDTFFKRHHLRIYRASGSYRGLPLWTSTATHDSGIAFSKSQKTFIHLIDHNIDEEREKVVNDLVLTGCVDAVDYTDRPWVPRDAKNATGEPLITDGRIAVLLLNRCTTPVRADTPDTSLPKIAVKGSSPVRALRDADLVIRNDFYRGNIVYQGYSGIRTGIGMLRKKRAAAPGQMKTFRYGGHEFQVFSGTNAPEIKGAPKDPGDEEAPYELPGEPPSFATVLDFSISAGYSRFANFQFSTQDMTLRIDTPPSPLVFPASFVTRLHSGYGIAPKVTLNSWKYISNEFGFSYNRANLSITSTNPGAPFTFDSFDGQIRQFTYNALFNLRPNGSRFRPYAAVGPAFQLLRAEYSKPKANSLLKFGFKPLALLVGTYQFGSMPPLEGGGIFQVGLQYGGGFKYQLTPRFFFRMDFRETLCSQPDFWTASYPTINSFNTDPFVRLDIGKLERFGELRQQLFSIGFGVSF